MIKTHIIYIPFTGVGTNKVLSPEWLADRIEIFKSYTLKSLLNQTNREFFLWLTFRPDEKDNPLVDELAEYMSHIEGLRFQFTFDGLMYHDDRNPEQNEILLERMEKSLAVLLGLGVDGDWFYLTRIDSDDMFHRDVVQLIQDQEPFEGALTLQLGYVYNKDTGEVAEWNPLTNPPFHTVMMQRETFYDPIRHRLAFGLFTSHEDIAQLKHKVLWRNKNRRDRLYMVLTHNPSMHISTTWDHEFKGKAIETPYTTISEFGI